MPMMLMMTMMRETMTLAFLLAALSSPVFVLGTRECCETEGHIAYRTRKLIPGVHEVEATDKSTTLQALVSDQQEGFLTCHLNTLEALVDDIVNDPTTTVAFIGTKEKEDVWRRCADALAASVFPTSSTSPRSSEAKNEENRRDSETSEGTREAGHGSLASSEDNSNRTQEIPFKPDYETGKPEGNGSHLAIVPGTNWCGKGNVANDYEDLGVHRQTDMCCRTHDHCPYFIPGLTRKYNAFNTKPWTISYCDCDSQFFQCLKHVNNNASEVVGKLFFGLLGVQCFNFDEGEICTEYHWTHLWCTSRENGTMAVITDFPFSWYGTPGQPIGK